MKNARTDLDLPKRLYEFLRVDPVPIAPAEISRKFDVPQERVKGLLDVYVNRGYLDRQHMGRGRYVYSIGPIEPDDAPRKRRYRKLPKIDVDALQVKRGTAPRRASGPPPGKNDAVFAKLREPHAWLEVDASYYDVLRLAAKRLNSSGGLARFAVGKHVSRDDVIVVQRLADAASTSTVRSIRRAA